MQRTTTELDAKRRQWAEDQIAACSSQIKGLERRITELQAFLGLLDATARSLDGEGGGLGLRAERIALKSLGDYIAVALTGASPRALSVGDVAKKVADSGYVTSAKTDLQQKIRAELQRLRKKGRFGIVRASRGKYAIREKH